MEKANNSDFERKTVTQTGTGPESGRGKEATEKHETKSRFIMSKISSMA